MQYDIWSSIFGVEFCEAIIIILYLWKLRAVSIFTGGVHFFAIFFAIEYPRLSEVNYTH